MNLINANAICLECGTTKQNEKTAYCINGHDNWLENNDDIYRFNIAIKKFNVDLNTIHNSINNNIDLIK